MEIWEVGGTFEFEGAVDCTEGGVGEGGGSELLGDCRLELFEIGRDGGREGGGGGG